MFNASDFNLLATRTANCLLGVDCGVSETVSTSKQDDAVTKPKQGVAVSTSNQGDAVSTPKEGKESTDSQIINPLTGNPVSGENIQQTLEDAVKRMAEEDKQQLMNKNSKGPYFLIFVLFFLLLGFSLDKDEE